jgi:hypothetical protein
VRCRLVGLSSLRAGCDAVEPALDLQHAEDVSEARLLTLHFEARRRPRSSPSSLRPQSVSQPAVTSLSRCVSASTRSAASALPGIVNANPLNNPLFLLRRWNAFPWLEPKRVEASVLFVAYAVTRADAPRNHRRPRRCSPGRVAAITNRAAARSDRRSCRNSGPSRRPPGVAHRPPRTSPHRS